MTQYRSSLPGTSRCRPLARLLLGAALAFFAIIALPRAAHSQAKQVPPMAGTFSDSKGLITVPFASGTAWDCAEKSGSQAGAEALLVRCRSKAPGEFFFMMAKDYTVPKEQVMAADKLATTVYKRDYEKFFKTVKYTKTGPVKQGRLQWYELAFQAEHAAKGPIHKVERVLVKGTHVLLLSAEGAPKDFAAHQVDTGRWLSKTAFATLK